MKFIEWFLNLFIGKKAKKVKEKAYLELKKVNENYLTAKKINDKYLSKYSGIRRYTKA
jgi:hypothetical protein